MSFETEEEPSYKPLILFKYGGNAMTNENLQKQILNKISNLKSKGYNVVIVHGGGPFIQKALDDAGIESEFIDGQRKTSAEAMEHVSMALIGKVNSRIVGLINAMKYSAVGISGKDGDTVIAKKRKHKTKVNGVEKEVDLGRVGEIELINTELIDLLLKNNHIPVISCIASDGNARDFNINADMFAGNMAAALKADEYIVLTDVDGLLEDKDKPETLIKNANISKLDKLIDDGIIQGGMIPKIDACKIAVNYGAKSARIINGTSPEQIDLINNTNSPGTLITKQ